MNHQARDSEKSPSDTKREFRQLAKEIDEALSIASMRRSGVAVALLDVVPSLYDIDPALVKEVQKIRGERLYKLRQELFGLFAKAGKRTPDEVLKSRIQALFARYLADKPKSGRRKKDSQSNS